jgi:glycosyltransferase involved in cell wall biosynthesis
MKILQLCKKFPYPLKDGESLAVQALAKGFTGLGCEVSLLAMNTSKHWFDTSLLPEELDFYHSIHTVEVDNRIKPFHAVCNLFTTNSYHIQRFVDRKFERKLIQLLQKNRYDVIQLETVFLAPYVSVIRKYSNALVVMRAHNVEHEIWERIACNSSSIKKWYLNIITPRLKAYEVEMLNRYDGLVCISERDMELFKKMGLNRPVTVAPIGLDARSYTPHGDSFKQKPTLAFIGSLDWMPNIEGLRWFLEEVWHPKLKNRFPDLEFHIAGRNTPDWLLQLNEPGIHVHGEVGSAQEYILQHSVMLVPLLSGGGMRAKILEGMALGRVVLSSKVGLEGIDALHEKEVLVADTPDEFAESVAWCLESGPMLEAMGNQARRFFESNFEQKEIAARLANYYREALKQHLVSV